MKTVLNLPNGWYSEVMSHLLPVNSRREEAAFFFATVHRTATEIRFDVTEMAKLGRADFAHQMDDYLELTDTTRMRLIKRAHDLKASLIELHSHPGPWPAVFSPADRIGLNETVPHMWWRLAKRPYLAIVVAPSGFDALVWLDNPETPVPLDALAADQRLLKPTNNSLRGW